MKATINGVAVEGTPQETLERLRIGPDTSNENWLHQRGNFPCCHIGCESEADFVFGKHYDDGNFVCKDHKSEYVLDDDKVKPIIRAAK